MAAKAKNTQEFGMLAGLVREYYDVDQDLKALQERHNYLNTAIKRLMKQCELDKYVADDLKAVLQTGARRSLNKESLLNLLKKLEVQEGEIAALYDTAEVVSLRITKLDD